MKKVLTVSLLAMMVVGAARADIASTDYADRVAASAQDAAEATAATNLSNTIKDYSTTAQMTDAIKVEADRATAAETVLGTRIDGLMGEAGILSGLDLTAVTAPGKAIVSVSQENGQLAASVGTIGTAGIDNGAVTTDKIADGNVTAAKLSSDVQTSLDKADAAAPQATTYNKTEVDAKISNDGVADAAAQKVTAPSIEYAQAMIDASQADLEDDVEELQGKVGETAVSVQITAAVEKLAGTDKTGTVDGSYVVAVAQENGKITSETVAFDDSLSATSKNAVQNKVVDAAIKAEATRATAAEATKVAKDDLGIGSSFNIPDTCKAEDAVCSLVVRAGVAGWEAVTY